MTEPPLDGRRLAHLRRFVQTQLCYEMPMRTLLVIGFILGIAACGSKKASNEPPPAQPATGAPVAFVAKSFKAGADRGGEVEVKGYNFSDKPVGQYMLLFQYKDASGAVLKVKP